MEYNIMRTAIDMRENTIKIKDKAMVRFSLKMALFKKENFRMVTHMVFVLVTINHLLTN